MPHYGVRSVRITPTAPPHDELLFVLVTCDGEVIAELPGVFVAPLRVALQQIEAENPGLVGDPGPMERAQVVRELTILNPDGTKGRVQ